MNNIKFIDALLNGASLSSVMTPNPALPSNQPAHDECYKLPFIFIDKERFIAQTNNMHRELRRKNQDTNSVEHTFNYSYGYDYSMLINCPKINNVLAGKMNSRYSKFEWRIRPEYKLAWHSDNPLNFNQLKSAVQYGKEMKLALKDEDGNWSILPIDTIDISLEQDSFLARTETAYTANLITAPDKYAKIMAQLDANRPKPTNFLQAPIPSFPIYYACYSDGTYYNFFDEKRTIKRPYKELRILTRSDDSNPIIEIPYI